MDGATFSPHIAPQYSRRNNYFVAGSPPPSPTYPSFYSPMMLAETSFGVGTPLPHIMTAKRSPPGAYHGNMMANYQNSLNLEALKLQRLNLDESVDSNHTDATHCTSKSDLLHATPNNRCTLPHHTVSPDKRTVIYTIEMVVREHLVECFAKDKIGCQFLQNKFPRSDPELKRAMLQELYKPGLFLALAKDVFANFFVQLIIQESTPEEQVWIVRELGGHMYEMCMNRYSCRVVQKVLDILVVDNSRKLLAELREADCVRMSVDQNANHVVQKIMETFPVDMWNFVVVSFMRSDAQFFEVAESKYGCRVMQLAIETLTDNKRDRENVDMKDGLLKRLLNRIILNCERLAAHEFANYVVQHILGTPSLFEYRDAIIEECLLRNLLSFSQEKFASHVVEKALKHASADFLKEMMEELFDGYIPDPETKKDCLDILLFHQFGNYIVQRMLTICLESMEKVYRGIPLEDAELRKRWYKQLQGRINACGSKLKRYSSGKKILETLYQFQSNWERSPHNARSRGYSQY